MSLTRRGRLDRQMTENIFSGLSNLEKEAIYNYSVRCKDADNGTNDDGLSQM
jgi:hypothetical protein